PFGIAGKRGGLFPPTVGHDQIHATVAVDVTDAETVGVFVPRTFGREAMKRPRLAGIRPVGLGVAEIAAGMTDQLRLPVAVDVGQQRRFVVDDIEDAMRLPKWRDELCESVGWHGGLAR